MSRRRPRLRGTPVSSHREAQRHWDMGHRVYGSPYDGAEDPVLLRSAKEILLYDPENLMVVAPDPEGNPRTRTVSAGDRKVTLSVNINDSTQDFTGQILRGQKVIETRDTLNNAMQGVLGQRIGITRTGTGDTKVVGYATVAKHPIVYHNESEFRRDQDKHLVEPGSKYDIKKGGVKYGYELTDVTPVEPFTPKSVGRKYSVIDPSHAPYDTSSEDIRNPRRPAPPQFPFDYADYLRRNFPEIWRAGGNVRGNDAFRWWAAYRRGDRSPTVMHWWNTTRPAWIARHFDDHRLPGVVAQIKWGTVGRLGVAGMKRVVEDAIRKGR